MDSKLKQLNKSYFPHYNAYKANQQNMSENLCTSNY